MVFKQEYTKVYQRFLVGDNFSLFLINNISSNSEDTFWWDTSGYQWPDTL